MDIYGLDLDEAIIIQCFNVTRDGYDESEFENEDLHEIVLTNKNIVYVVSDVDADDEEDVDVIKVPLSAIKVIGGQAQVKGIKHSSYGNCLQVQFKHGVEYWKFGWKSKTLIPQWEDALKSAVVGPITVAAHAKPPADPQDVSAVAQVTRVAPPKPTVPEVPHIAPEPPAAKPKKEKITVAAFAGIASSLKNVADAANHAVSTAVEQIADSNQQKSEPKKNAVKRFCTNCGERLQEGAKFCQSCGSPVSGVSTSAAPQQATVQHEAANESTRHTERRQEYVGAVLKCPHCGGVISETTALCPECGMRITGQTAVSSVQAFKEQLMEIENSRKKSIFGVLNVYAPADPADKKKLALIKNYPIPNTVDDILEFILLAVANIDVNLSKRTWANSAQGMQILALEMPREISNAWVAKLQQAYQKAEIMFPSDPMFTSIQRLYREKMAELKIKV